MRYCREQGYIITRLYSYNSLNNWTVLSESSSNNSMTALVPSLNLKLRLPSTTRQASKHFDLTLIFFAFPLGLSSEGLGNVPTEIGSLRVKHITGDSGSNTIMLLKVEVTASTSLVS